MEQVKKIFRTKLEKTGIALTVNQLWNYVKQQKIKDVSKKEVATFISKEPVVTQFSKVLTRNKKYQTVGVLRSGVFFIDYAEFSKKDSSFNDNKAGFILSVENFTNKLFVIPTKTKGTEDWERAVEQFVDISRQVSIIYSDRDAVATSEHFRKKLFDKYGVRWYFLKKGNKSFLAERYIGFVKTKLSQALLYHKTKRWIDFVDPLCQEYNKEKIENTSYTRSSINKTNFDHFLSQFFKTPNPDLLFNSFKAGPFENKEWNKLAFKFDLGEKVFVARRANWLETTEKLKTFDKISKIGGFGSTVFTISGRQLRTAKDRKTFIPCYSLEEMGPSLHFYQTELKKVY